LTVVQRRGIAMPLSCTAWTSLGRPKPGSRRS